MKKAIFTFVSSAILLSSLTVSANSKQEAEAIDYRQSTFKMVKWHIGPMAGMARGKIDYDAASFTKNAESIAALSKLAANGFLIKSLSDDSDSKPEIWENKADFDKKMEAFVTAADNLVVASKSNDMKTIGPVFGEMGATCKGCHDEYRIEK